MVIKDIYEQYSIPPILQKHMYSVAALGQLIANAVKKSRSDVDVDEVVQGLLVHDMGNIVKFDLTKNDFFTHEELPHWQALQKEYIEKYSANDHEATLNILKELGVKKNIINLIAYTSSTETALAMLEKDINFAIMFYADFRVGPNGLLSLDARIDDLLVRYKNRTEHYWSNKERAEKMRDVMKEYEIKLSDFASLAVDQIRDEDLTSSLQLLSSYPIDLNQEP